MQGRGVWGSVSAMRKELGMGSEVIGAKEDRRLCAHRRVEGECFMRGGKMREVAEIWQHVRSVVQTGQQGSGTSGT